MRVNPKNLRNPVFRALFELDSMPSSPIVSRLGAGISFRLSLSISGGAPAAPDGGLQRSESPP